MIRPTVGPGDRPLTWFERVGLWLLFLALVGFGGVVLQRSAFAPTRMTDLGVYLRAAHAVRTGAGIYDKLTCDDNGWHFCYPPPFAFLMVPLADPYQWETDRTGYLPYWVSVVVWYGLSVWLAWAAADRFARAALPDARPGSRRWWYARTVPLYVCVASLAFTLSRGQVNTLAVWLIAGMFAAAVGGQPVRAGGWLAAAVALKVIPAYLGLFLVTDRPGRAVRGVLGLVAGLVILLGLFPAAVWGWEKMVATNRTFVNVVLAPGALGSGDQTRARELTDATATDSQSFQAVLHNLQHPDPDTRPDKVDRNTRLAHWGIGGRLPRLPVVVGVWVWGFGSSATASGPQPLAAGDAEGISQTPNPKPQTPDRLVYLGCLSAVMLLVTPVSHVHYYAYVLPLVAGLWLRGLAARPGAAFADRRTTLVLAGWGAAIAVLVIPGREIEALRDAGLGVAATVGLWGYGVAALLRSPTR